MIVYDIRKYFTLGTCTKKHPRSESLFDDWVDTPSGTLVLDPLHDRSRGRGMKEHAHLHNLNSNTPLLLCY